MKIVVIMGREEFQDKLFHILKEMRINAFSKFDVMGHRVADADNLSQWYDTAEEADYSKVVFTLLPGADKATDLLKEIRMLNESSVVESKPFRACVIDVEQFV